MTTLTLHDIVANKIHLTLAQRKKRLTNVNDTQNIIGLVKHEQAAYFVLNTLKSLDKKVSIQEAYDIVLRFNLGETSEVSFVETTSKEILGVAPFSLVDLSEIEDAKESSAVGIRSITGFSSGKKKANESEKQNLSSQKYKHFKLLAKLLTYVSLQDKRLKYKGDVLHVPRFLDEQGQFHQVIWNAKDRFDDLLKDENFIEFLEATERRYLFAVVPELEDVKDIYRSGEANVDFTTFANFKEETSGIFKNYKGVIALDKERPWLESFTTV